MPLCTILTKCPAPLPPQCRYPCSAVPPTFSRPRVRATSPPPPAIRPKIGSRYPRPPTLPPPRSPRHIPPPRSNSPEDRIQILHRPIRPPNHHAVPPLQPPHPPAGPHIQILNSFFLKLLRAADIVDVIRIPAIDQN